MKKIYNLKLTNDELNVIFALAYSYTERMLEKKQFSDSDIKNMDVASKICMKVTEAERKEMLKNECKRFHERKHQSKTCN